ncbi:GntR family transcriptional regulator [Bosea sp. 685]|uniref:GntR family transcriptional regulator n=1 Tax=Bosea sp. 685 TaxID=3080057 RepID=UPI002893314D|nr:GntR family transcriptional regulator [Bosea sp. 685]WNJ91524.1 GntR family transcriptional regulator [Bosea sp. 685]
MLSLKLQPTKSLAQKAVARLRQAIIEGELPLGAFIAEEMLAQSFGVSRTPVREALNQLQLQGLVVVKPQVGSFVFSPDAEDIATICQFRIILEPKAAELAYNRDRDSVVTEIEAAIAGMEQALKAKDNVAYGRADTALHEAFFNHCGNRYLQESYRLVAGRVAALRTNLSSPIDVQTPRSFEEHRAILGFFQAGDFASFTSLMTAHIANSGETYAKALLG